MFLLTGGRGQSEGRSEEALANRWNARHRSNTRPKIERSEMSNFGYRHSQIGHMLDINLLPDLQ